MCMRHTTWGCVCSSGHKSGSVASTPISVVGADGNSVELRERSKV